jgi:hypothetical protein
MLGHILRLKPCLRRVFTSRVSALVDGRLLNTIHGSYLRPVLSAMSMAVSCALLLLV